MGHDYCYLMCVSSLWQYRAWLDLFCFFSYMQVMHVYSALYGTELCVVLCCKYVT